MDGSEASRLGHRVCIPVHCASSLSSTTITAQSARIPTLGVQAKDHVANLRELAETGREDDMEAYDKVGVHVVVCAMAVW